MDEYKFWFANLDISLKLKNDIYFEYKSEKEIYLRKKDIYFNNKGIDKKILNILNDIDVNLYEKAKKSYIDVINIEDSKYPNSLKDIKNAPLYLFFKGNIDLLNTKVNCSIVGSRKCTSYGREVTKLITKKLSEFGINIISGGALGIDSIAHKTSIENNNSTVAILGCGIDVCYPAYNKELYSNIINNGCVISEFILGTPPLSYNFPRRNRIISGISNPVIIVEGTNKSGSMITAKYALEYGKDILAVPGNIFSPLSEGPNTLIKDGALVIDSLEELSVYFNFKIGKKKIENKGTLKDEVLKILSEGPKHIDEIIRYINIDTSDIYRLLFEMQFNNEIISLLGNYYSKVN